MWKWVETTEAIFPNEGCPNQSVRSCPAIRQNRAIFILWGETRAETKTVPPLGSFELLFSIRRPTVFGEGANIAREAAHTNEDRKFRNKQIAAVTLVASCRWELSFFFGSTEAFSPLHWKILDNAHKFILQIRYKFNIVPGWSHLSCSPPNVTQGFYLVLFNNSIAIDRNIYLKIYFVHILQFKNKKSFPY